MQQRRSFGEGFLFIAKSKPRQAGFFDGKGVICMTERNNVGKIGNGVSVTPRGDIPPMRREMRSSVDLSIFDRNPNIEKSRANVGSVSTK